ncbi:MAG: sigma-70 family RNA polymerase sigma factor [Halioglobus sp.]
MDKMYRQWISAHQDRVWSLALYLLQDRALAEDISQEAFLRLWQRRNEMHEERVGPWLLRVTRNLCLDKLRKSRVEREPEEGDLVDDETPERARLRGNHAQRLRELVAAMREPQRSLVVLRDMQQHSYQEVAEITGLSQPQVKTYLHRARKLLRQQWSEQEHE